MNGFGSASPRAQIRPQGPRLREPKQMASLCYIYMLHRHNAKTDGFPFRLRTLSDAEIHTYKRKVDTLPSPNVNCPHLFLTCAPLRASAWRLSFDSWRGHTVARTALGLRRTTVVRKSVPSRLLSSVKRDTWEKLWSDGEKRFN